MVRFLLDLLVFGGVLLVELLVRCLPPAGAEALAVGAGELWYRLDGRRRARALESVRVAMRGGLEVEDPRRLAHDAFPNLMRVPVEAIRIPRYFGSRTQVLDRCTFHGDWGPLVEDLRARRGGLFVGGHLGNWEFAGWAFQFLEVPCRVVARPIENRFIDARATRARGGEDWVIRKAGAVKKMLQTLRGGGWVGVMADQNAGRGGVFIPFFGLEASCYAAPAVLALRAGVPVYAGASLRRSGRPMRFELHVERLEPPPAGSTEKEAVRWLLRGYLATLERLVKRAPEQYNWIHRRWKSRPPREAPGARLPTYAAPAPRSSASVR